MGGGAHKESGNFFSPLIICMACMTAMCLAIVAYHLLVAKYCVARRRQLIAEAIVARHDQLADDSPLGVEERILRTIPIFAYPGDKLGPDDFCADRKECAVCLGELEDGESVRMLPGCRHVFHATCIDRWFLAKSSCPVCRLPVRAVPAAEEGRVSAERSSSVWLLRQCASLGMRPVEAEGSTRRGAGLKRSFSMVDGSKTPTL